jgi:menaquinol-cytochrome c reductase cytochrome b/c subunit
MKIFLLSIALAMILNACDDQTNSAAKDTIDEPYKKGRQIYEARCVVCHGSDGSSGASGAANLQLSNLDAAGLFNLIKEGRRNMPAYKEMLSDDEIVQVSKYINELKK